MSGAGRTARSGNLASRLLLIGSVTLLAGVTHADAATAQQGSTPQESTLQVSTPQESTPQESTQQEFRHGQALFAGDLALHGRIRTHLVDLPPQVVVCGNCHAAGHGPEVARSLAPRLTRELLLAPRARRGGPVTTYNEDRFCTLLRKGIDPSYVLLSVEMPIYTMDDSDCRALWQFVMRERA